MAVSIASGEFQVMKLPLVRKGLLLLLLVLPATINGIDDEDDSLASRIDALERQLEMGRHARLTAQKTASKSVLAGFTTDGCSGGLSVGWEVLAGKIEHFQEMHGVHPAWESCCITHDRAYHAAGGREDSAVQSFDARKRADLTLQACVMETGVKRTTELSAAYNVSAREVEILYTTIADLMYRAVRVGGMPCTGLPWRWGYGWPTCD